MPRKLVPLAAIATLLFMAATSLAAGAAEAGEKQPELIAFDPTTAIWVLVIFVLMLAILYPTAWKGVLAGLKTREERIRKDITDAEATRARAEETLKQYQQQLATAEDRVRELLAKAQTDGERLAATIREKAMGEAEGVKNKALSDIEEASKNAVAKIHAEMAELSTAIAEKIIRKNLNVDDQRELVRASLEQLEAGRN